MVLTGLILTAVIGGALGALIVKFWNPIHNWVKKIISIVQKKIQEKVLGVFLFIRKSKDGTYRQVSRNISRRNDKYIQTDVVNTTEPIAAEDVPKDILEKLKQKSEIDVSEKYQQVLTNQV